MMENKAQKIGRTHDGKEPKGGESLTCGHWGGLEGF